MSWGMLKGDISAADCVPFCKATSRKQPRGFPEVAMCSRHTALLEFTGDTQRSMHRNSLQLSPQLSLRSHHVQQACCNVGRYGAVRNLPGPWPSGWEVPFMLQAW